MGGSYVLSGVFGLAVVALEQVAEAGLHLEVFLDRLGLADLHHSGDFAVLHLVDGHQAGLCASLATSMVRLASHPQPRGQGTWMSMNFGPSMEMAFFTLRSISRG